jgi:U3 small nucleolar RNA-associated protein MPP10
MCERTFAKESVPVEGTIIQEAKQLFERLGAKLDALSHLSLAPKPVVSELEVRVNAAAIAMEEAAPVTMSTASMQAPEEVHAPVRSILPHHCSFC